MSTNLLSIAVTASAELAFDFVADPTNEKEWNPGVVRAARTSPGPIGVGSTFRHGRQDDRSGNGGQSDGDAF